MAKTKHQKSKSKKQPHIKKYGKQADIPQLRELGLKIIQVAADGNCFFRALADQLEGDEEKHDKYRSMVVQYIEKNRELFEPFIEDEVPFHEYCQSMEKDGTWAGHMELQAASHVTRSNICIHQNMSPRWYVRNFDHCGARMIHLSYHDGEHYNSVRSHEDPCDGPARPIIIKADADFSATSHQVKAGAGKSKAGAGKNIIHAGSVRQVMEGSGCENVEKVEQVLLQVDGDIDAAVEFMIADQGTEEYLVENNKLPLKLDTSFGDEENGDCKLGKKIENNTGGKDPPSNCIEKNRDNTNSLKDNKRIPKNKACPCGSKKKHKSCCVSTAGRSSVELAVHINQEVDYGKKRKERMQGKKGGVGKAAASYRSGGLQADMGALCI